MNTLVIGYGNPLRGDDGVGPQVVERLAAWSGEKLQTCAVHQLTPELAVEISLAEEVWFVDAWVGGTTPTVQRLTVSTALPLMDHGWQPEGLLQLAKTLYDAEPVAYHLLIPAQQFDYGESLSEMALNGVDWAVQTIKVTVDTSAMETQGENQEVCYIVSIVDGAEAQQTLQELNQLEALSS